jgi:hypothetical protein
MCKRISILFLALFCIASQAQGQSILNTASPKLKNFLKDKPAALNALTNILTEAFSTNSLQLFYFYSDDESKAKAFHYYPNTGGLADVFICVRENQTPLDEFIGLFYEAANTRGQDRFRILANQARSNTISRAEFAKEILKVEFEAEKRTQTMLAALKLTKKESADSYYYTRYAEMPSEFEDYLSWIRKISPQRHAIEEYESQYDWLRKTSEDPTGQTNSVTPQK